MSAEILAGLHRNGFAHVDDLGISPGAFDQVRRHLDALFDRFPDLPADKVHDLAGRPVSAQPLVPEILDVSTLDPALRRTEVFRAVSRLARVILGRGSYLAYDHAIYKPPGPSAPTNWHQDSGFDQVLDHGIAIWVPLQGTGVIDGCMHYVPTSHARGRIPHERVVLADTSEQYRLSVVPGSAVALPCGLGGVVVHDFHTVHGAGPNLGENVRRAWIMNFSTAGWARRAYRQGKYAARTSAGSSPRLAPWHSSDR